MDASNGIVAAVEEESRPNRKRVRPNRFGETASEKSYNDLIEEIDSVESNSPDTMPSPTLPMESASAPQISESTPSKSNLLHNVTFPNCNCKCSELLECMMRKIDAMQEQLIELTVRMNHSGPISLDTTKVFQLGNIDTDQLQQFGLPSDSQLGLETLNKKLKNDLEFKKKLANCIGKIGGNEGNSDGETVLEKIVHSLIEPPFLRKISWTGRGKKNERKISLSKLSHLTDFIKQMTFKADKTFNEIRFKEKLVYDLLKRAVSKYGGDSENFDDDDDGDDADKENEGRPSNALNKGGNSDAVAKNILISTSISQPNSSQQQQQQQQQPPNQCSSNEQPNSRLQNDSNGQPPNVWGQNPSQYYPPMPYMPYHYQHPQHYQQQQPNSYGYHGSYEWPPSAPPNTNTSTATAGGNADPNTTTAYVQL